MNDAPFDVEQALQLTRLHRSLPPSIRIVVWATVTPEVRKLLDSVPLGEAAEITGVSTATHRSWIASGRIPSTEWQGQSILRLSAIKHALDNPPNRGRPLKLRTDFTRW